ncbi:hypothetical protein LEN26_004897, partial [Aphanomyces euteiches]
MGNRGGGTQKKTIADLHPTKVELDDNEPLQSVQPPSRRWSQVLDLWPYWQMQSAPTPQSTSNQRPINQLSFLSFCVDVHDSPYKGNWSLARLLRERNFGRTTVGLFDNLDVTTCHHVLTF